MRKILIIIQREYLSRVRRKSFIISTFLFPLFIILLIVASVFMAVKSSEVKNIAVSDEAFFNSLKSDSSNVVFTYNPTVNQQNFDEKGFDGYLKLHPKDSLLGVDRIFTRKSLGLETRDRIRTQLRKAYENNLLEKQGIRRVIIDSVLNVVQQFPKAEQQIVNDEGKIKAANEGLAYGIGFGSGVLIYITMFVFGAMVMRGVMEEKMNRIAEVIVSSVKPFQLMMGKIIGIAAVGLTQFLMWIVLLVILFSALQLFIPADAMQHAQENMAANSNSTLASQMMKQKDEFLGGANWSLIITCFFFYFLGGYLFYAALFAAVGSVVNEDPQEAQSLMLPITMPIILGFVILSSTVSHPNSPTAFWGSMIPFTSPIVMMGRVANGVPDIVPWWQLFLSMALLVVGFMFTTWFAGKIYRTGILLYGKRVTWKEMLKWLRRSS
jgi:ABC-2 type transport system permease protein